MWSPATATRSVVSRTCATSSSRMPIAGQVTARVRRPGALRSDPAGEVFGTPPEELDAETERVPVGHAADVPDREGGGGARAGLDVGAVGFGEASGRVGETVDEAAEEADDSFGLAAGGRSQVDPLEVEVPEGKQCRRRGFGHADVAGSADGVEDGEHE